MEDNNLEIDLKEDKLILKLLTDSKYNKKWWTKDDVTKLILLIGESKEKNEYKIKILDWLLWLDMKYILNPILEIVRSYDVNSLEKNHFLTKLTNDFNKYIDTKNNEFGFFDYLFAIILIPFTLFWLYLFFFLLFFIFIAMDNSFWMDVTDALSVYMNIDWVFLFFTILLPLLVIALYFLLRNKVKKWLSSNGIKINKYIIFSYNLTKLIIVIGIIIWFICLCLYLWDKYKLDIFVSIVIYWICFRRSIYKIYYKI